MNMITEPYPENSELEGKSGIIEEQFLDLKFLSVYGDFDVPENYNQYDAIRIFNPTKRQREKYKNYRFKPSILYWETKVNESDEKYLLTLKRKQMKAVKAALEYCKENYTLVLENVLTKKNLDEFYELYNQQIAHMKNGINVASQDYYVLLENSDKFFAIYVKEDDKIIGGVLSIKKDERKVLRAVYSATDKLKEHKVSISRILYFNLIKSAREIGYTAASLGSDPNLYGHVVKCGLFKFKRLMGFEPFVASTIEEGGPDMLELLVNPSKFGSELFDLVYDKNNNITGQIYEISD